MNTKRLALAALVIGAIVTANMGYHLHAALTAPPSVEAVRLAHPIAAPYWSPSFVLERRNVHAELTEAFYWRVLDYAGTAYHYQNGERIVPAAPADYTHTLWLFGNSGIEDPYLPDRLTAANVLQQALLGAGYRWRVVLRAAGGQKLRGQVAWLRETPIQVGDSVVFVDGAMDDLTDVGDFNAVADEAQRWTLSHGAAWYHFLQPHHDWRRPAAMRGVALYVPPDLFIESGHLDERGAVLEARQIYDWITIF